MGWEDWRGFQNPWPDVEVWGEAAWRGWGWGTSGIPVKWLKGFVLLPQPAAFQSQPKRSIRTIKEFSEWACNFPTWQWSYGTI